MVVSNTVTITETGIVYSMSISSTTSSVPATGGTVSFTGTSNFPNGTPLYIFSNGVQIGTTSVGSGGAISFAVNIPANGNPTTASFSVDLSTDTANT